MKRALLLTWILFTTACLGQPYWKVHYTGAPGPVEAIAMTSNGNVFVATLHEGLLKSYDECNSWTRDTLTFYQAFDVVSTPTDMLVLSIDGWGFNYYSTNHAQTWTPFPSPRFGIFDFALGPNSELYGASQYNGVQLSTDNGSNWESIGPVGLGSITHIETSVNGDVYASDGLSLFRSTNNGDSWDDLTYKVPNRNFLSISAGKSGTVYVGAYGPFGHVLASSDRGETWREMHTINTDIHVVGVVELENGALIAATENAAVWASTDNGDTWISFWEGFDRGGANCIYQARNGRVFLGAAGAIYELIEYPVSTNQTPAPVSLSLAQSYPNPVSAGQSAYINFSIASEEYITLSVYNTAGQNVAILAQGTYQPGTHTVQFNSSRLPAGVYVYRLLAGGREMSKVISVVQ